MLDSDGPPQRIRFAGWSSVLWGAACLAFMAREIVPSLRDGFSLRYTVILSHDAALSVIAVVCGIALVRGRTWASTPVAGYWGYLLPYCGGWLWIFYDWLQRISDMEPLHSEVLKSYLPRLVFYGGSVLLSPAVGSWALVRRSRGAIGVAYFVGAILGTATAVAVRPPQK